MARSYYNYEETIESTPLLSVTDEHDHESDGNTRRESWQTSENISLLVMLIVLLLSLGDQLMENPQIRIMESVVCYRYYEQADPSKLLLGREDVGPGAVGGVKEMLCKTDDVQSELAMLRGWQQLFDGIPNLLLALPFGWIADRYGRKPLVVAGMFAFVLRAGWIQVVTWFWQAFDIRMTWLSSAFASLGGGGATTSALCFVVLSDVVPESKRAGVFLRVGAFNVLASLVMPPLAAWLMIYNPWIPTLGGTVLMLIPALLVPFFPETLNFRHRSYPHMFDTDTGVSDAAAPYSDSTALGKASRLGFARQWLSELKRATSFLTNDWRIPILTLPFLAHMLLGLCGPLLLQYVSKRYGLTFSKATLLMTVRSGVVVLLLFVILPYVSTAVQRRYRLSAQKKDLYLARTSQILVAIGWTLIGLSPNIPTVAVSMAIASLGMGAPLLLRSFLTSLVPSHQIARVFSFLSVVDILGAMSGSPFLAGLFKRGLALGGTWIGLPFYFTGFISALFVFLLFSIQLRKGEDERINVDEDE